MNHKISRRQVLKLGLGVAAVSPLSAWGATPTAGFDWQQQKGKSLVVLLTQAPYHTVLQKMGPDFEKLTGIKVEIQVVPEQQVRQKLPIELNTKSPGIDVYASSMHVEKRLFAKAGWYEPLNKYLENPKLSLIDCALLTYAKLNKATPLYTFDRELSKQESAKLVS